ncbi:membrane-associated protein, putative [Bodo saltans]|uniref:Membrane-associated protein, putative n=1 Tax=Bodo saltans TaxID=75058 RepID=A0A0S4IXP8_BODSA|nr:membrane-associated protein, putative [Bodo saltans]|eukprot:CUG06564.1 membrane-associated protein, putative [Bodo saltans]
MMLAQSGGVAHKLRCCPSIERRYAVLFLLVLLPVLPAVILLIAPRSNTFASNDDTTSTLDARDFTPQEPEEPPSSSSSSTNVCDQLRTALRGNTTAEWSRRLLPHVYQKDGLLPPNSRLVLNIFTPKRGFGLCNVRSFVLDSLVLAALVGADIILPSAETLDRPPSEPIAHQLEGYYDVQHLRAEWKRFCPSMTLYHDRRSEGSRGPFLEELEEEPGALVVRHSIRVDVGSTRTDEDAVHNNVEYRLSEMEVDIRSFLAGTKRRPALMRRKSPAAAGYFVVTTSKQMLWDWVFPVEDAALGELRRAVGASLRSPEYIMRVAAGVVEHLKALGEESGNGQRFCGAHLRSEPDMVGRAGNFANGTLGACR